MPPNTSTNLTGKQETFFVGASHESYNKPSSRNLLHENNESYNKIFFSVALPTLTDDTSISLLEEYLQVPINQLLIDRRVLQNEAVRRTFLYRGVANFQYLLETGTSTLPSVQFLSPDSIPTEIKKCLYRLFDTQESESTLYEVSNLVAEWLMEAPSEYQTFFIGYMQALPLMSSRILIAALSDAEFSTNNENLLSSISLFLKSTDKRLAQAAATFLLICGGTLGKEILGLALSTEEVPHSKLVKGISELLS